MSEKILSSTLAAAVITSCLTILGTSVIQGYQNRLDARVRFLDGAQATAEETSRLLAEGYSALEKLRHDGSGKSFEQYIVGPDRDFDEFYRDWKQRVIENQFKLTRYFGKDLANNIMHLDEIDVSPVNNLASPNICTPPGSVDSADINKLMNEVSCYTRLYSFSSAPLDPNKEENMREFIARTDHKGQVKDHLDNLMNAYEVGYVKILRLIDNRFTELGALKTEVRLKENNLNEGT